jgi:large subunit ribosomal protein L35
MAQKHRTRKAALKRFKITKTGKVLHRSQHIRHLQSKKSKSQLRRLSKLKAVKGVFEKKILRMLGKK